MKLYLFFILIILQSCSHLFYQPATKHLLDPKQLKLEYKNLSFKSKDHTTLHGWLFKAKSTSPKGTIVQFHGNAENISTHFLSLIWVIDHGYNLFTFDYRGYGKSKGVASQQGVHEDALAALEYAQVINKENGEGKIIIYGQSLGGAIALKAVSEWEAQKEIDLLVIDSSFSSYQGIAFDKLTDHWFLFPFSPLAYLAVSDSYAPKKVLKKISTSTLVITGKKDKIVPPKFGKEIYQGLGTKLKWLWKLPNGGHINAYHHEEGIYRKKLMTFLDRFGQE